MKYNDIRVRTDAAYLKGMNFFRKIHLWLAVPFGIVVTLICFSGAMLVFEDEITRWCRSDVYYVDETGGRPVDMQTLMQTVKGTLPGDVYITGVTVCDDPGRAYQVNLSRPRRAAVFINQYTGEITGCYERLGFFETMHALHRRLLDDGPSGGGVSVGKMIVGISTITFVIALLTGIVLWWPRARKNLRRSLTVLSGKAFWNTLHVAGGMYVVVIVLAMALTGLTWSFGWYRTGFYAICGVSNTPYGMSQGRGNGQGYRHGATGASHQNGATGATKQDGATGATKQDGATGATGHAGRGTGLVAFEQWQRVYDEIKAANPDAPQITVGDNEATVTLSHYGNTGASDRYTYDMYTAEITGVTRASDAGRAGALRGWIYSIHTGAVGGYATRILWFLAALFGASLPLTGYYLWLRRLRRKNTAKK